MIPYMMHLNKGGFWNRFLEKIDSRARNIEDIAIWYIYEKCSPDVGENDGRTFRIIGTHPEELLLHIHHSMISGFWKIFTDFRLQTKISRVIGPPLGNWGVMIMFYPKNHQELIPKNSSSKFRPSNWQKSRKKSRKWWKFEFW